MREAGQLVEPDYSIATVIPQVSLIGWHSWRQDTVGIRQHNMGKGVINGTVAEVKQVHV